MTLDEAVKYQRALLEGLSEEMLATYGVALKLSIEALEFCEKYKLMIMQPNQTLLPGETEE